LLFIIIDLPHRNLYYLHPMKKKHTGGCVLYLPSYSRHIFRHVTDRHDNENTLGINVFHVSNFSLDIWNWRDESWINAALPRSCLSAIIYTRFNASLELHLTRTYFKFPDWHSGLARIFGLHCPRVCASRVTLVHTFSMRAFLI